MNNHLTLAANGHGEMRANGGRTKRDQYFVDLIMHSLDSIRKEIALGTEVDPNVVKDIETRLAIFAIDSDRK
jgi:hypothetical protein